MRHLSKCGSHSNDGLLLLKTLAYSNPLIEDSTALLQSTYTMVSNKSTVLSIIIVSLYINFQLHAKDAKSKKDNIHQQLIIAVTLSVSFGLGWGIGMLATQDIHTNKTVRDLFAALFVIITAFYNLLILIMECLCSKEV